MAGTPDPKPRGRLRISPAAYTKLTRALKEQWPRDHRGLATETCHHYVPRDAGGDDVAENLVPLNGSGTTGTHGLVEMSRIERARLRRWLEKQRPEVIAYAVDRKGEFWHDRKYPREEET